MENENQNQKVETVDTPQPGLDNDTAKAIREATEAKLLRKLGVANIDEAIEKLNTPTVEEDVQETVVVQNQVDSALLETINTLSAQVQSLQVNNEANKYVQEGISLDKAQRLVGLQNSLNAEELEALKQSYLVKDTAIAAVQQPEDNFDYAAYMESLANKLTRK